MIQSFLSVWVYLVISLDNSVNFLKNPFISASVISVGYGKINARLPKVKGSGNSGQVSDFKPHLEMCSADGKNVQLVLV